MSALIIFIMVLVASASANSYGYASPKATDASTHAPAISSQNVTVVAPDSVTSELVPGTKVNITTTTKRVNTTSETKESNAGLLNVVPIEYDAKTGTVSVDKDALIPTATVVTSYGKSGAELDVHQMDRVEELKTFDISMPGGISVRLNAQNATDLTVDSKASTPVKSDSVGGVLADLAGDLAAEGKVNDNATVTMQLNNDQPVVSAINSYSYSNAEFSPETSVVDLQILANELGKASSLSPAAQTVVQKLNQTMISPNSNGPVPASPISNGPDAISKGINPLPKGAPAGADIVPGVSVADKVNAAKLPPSKVPTPAPTTDSPSTSLCPGCMPSSSQTTALNPKVVPNAPQLGPIGAPSAPKVAGSPASGSSAPSQNGPPSSIAGPMQPSPADSWNAPGLIASPSISGTSTPNMPVSSMPNSQNSAPLSNSSPISSASNGGALTPSSNGASSDIGKPFSSSNGGGLKPSLSNGSPTWSNGAPATAGKPSSSIPYPVNGLNQPGSSPNGMGSQAPTWDVSSSNGPFSPSGSVTPSSQVGPNGLPSSSDSILSPPSNLMGPSSNGVVTASGSPLSASGNSPMLPSSPNGSLSSTIGSSGLPSGSNSPMLSSSSGSSATPSGSSTPLPSTNGASGFPSFSSDNSMTPSSFNGSPSTSNFTPTSSKGVQSPSAGSMTPSSMAPSSSAVSSPSNGLTTPTSSNGSPSSTAPSSNGVPLSSNGLPSSSNGVPLSSNGLPVPSSSNGSTTPSTSSAVPASPSSGPAIPSSSNGLPTSSSGSMSPPSSSGLPPLSKDSMTPSSSNGSSTPSLNASSTPSPNGLPTLVTPSVNGSLAFSPSSVTVSLSTNIITTPAPSNGSSTPTAPNTPMSLPLSNSSTTPSTPLLSSSGPKDSSDNGFSTSVSQGLSWPSSASVPMTPSSSTGSKTPSTWNGPSTTSGSPSSMNSKPWPKSSDSLSPISMGFTSNGPSMPSSTTGSMLPSVSIELSANGPSPSWSSGTPSPSTQTSIPNSINQLQSSCPGCIPPLAPAVSRKNRSGPADVNGLTSNSQIVPNNGRVARTPTSSISGIQDSPGSLTVMRPGSTMNIPSRGVPSTASNLNGSTTNTSRTVGRVTSSGKKNGLSTTSDMNSSTTGRVTNIIVGDSSTLINASVPLLPNSPFLRIRACNKSYPGATVDQVNDFIDSADQSGISIMSFATCQQIASYIANYPRPSIFTPEVCHQIGYRPTMPMLEGDSLNSVNQDGFVFVVLPKLPVEVVELTESTVIRGALYADGSITSTGVSLSAAVSNVNGPLFASVVAEDMVMIPIDDDDAQNSTSAQDISLPIVDEVVYEYPVGEDDIDVVLSPFLDDTDNSLTAGMEGIFGSSSDNRPDTGKYQDKVIPKSAGNDISSRPATATRRTPAEGRYPERN